MAPDARSALRLGAHGVLALVCLFFLGTPAVMISGLRAPAANPPDVARETARPLPPPRLSPPGPLAFLDRPGASRVLLGRAPGRPGGRTAVLAAPAVRLAIVIDDIGHDLEVVRELLALNRPLTYAVLPMRAHSRGAADLIRRAGGEIIVHIPMEPYRYPRKDPGPMPLLLSHSLGETAFRVREYLDSLPEAIGASNHMGSAYTHDDRRMEVVQTILAERELFFFNSRTSGADTPWRIARRWGYPYLERDVFLDHDPAPEAVRAAFAEVVRRARRYGRAIAIGHPYPQTLRVLRQNLPRLAGKGVHLVPLSRMLSP